VELYLHCTNTPSWRVAHLKHRDNFTFIIIIIIVVVVVVVVIIIIIIIIVWGPCHQGTARPRFSDGGDGLLITEGGCECIE
jgi:heme/copper-type cytochrome/quinol oxidase subunit 2